MTGYISLLLPELILGTVACVLMLMGCSMKVSTRKLVPFLALVAMIVVFAIQLGRQTGDNTTNHTLTDLSGTLRLFHFAQYIKLLVAGVGIMLLLLAWPTNAEGTGNSALNVGQETGEFFGLMLLSLCGIFLVAGANDIILLFLGIELASIPTYIMVSISRPNPIAQEAGVKYFFLGAMSAAVMLFGFSYLYGTTGNIKLDQISQLLHPSSAVHGLASSASESDPSQTMMPPWVLLAIIMLVVGFAFKIAAVPLHVYAGDVYQGAATPVTAFLSFVPKTSGFVALIKILYAAGGPSWALPPQLAKLLWVLAVLTMTFGNVLGLLQTNLKRLLAYSSVAHSGYMLTGIAALAGAYLTAGRDRSAVQTDALAGVIFYLTAYGIMNAAAFGVLMLLPARHGRAGTSAETFEDIAGQGRRHVGLGLCMAVACFSLIGIPLTVGFWGKVFLIKPAFSGGNYWLVIIVMINAAISAAYYLRIIGTMFLRDPANATSAVEQSAVAKYPLPITAAIAISVLGTLLLGTVLPLTQVFTTGSHIAARIDEEIHTAK